MTNKPAWKIAEEQRLIDKFATDVNLVDGVPYWKSNGNVPPADVVQLWLTNGLMDDVEAEQAAAVRDEQTRAAIADYRRAQATRSPEQIAEQRAEARAAHGPGVRLVNVLTGESYTT